MRDPILKQNRGRKYITALGVFTLSGALLFLSFYGNTFRVADHDWFLSFSRDCESFILGRLIKSGQDGIFSYGGLTAKGATDASCSHFIDDFDAYLQHTHVNYFLPYYSQIGGQGILFSLLDRVLPLSPALKLRLFHVLASLLTAAMLAAVILWFYLEFGLVVGICVLFFAAASQWLTVFGRNLWWSTWAFYLPMTVMMYYGRYAKPQRAYVKLGVLIFFSVLTKTIFNGYEYITTTLLMMAVPFIYYSVAERLAWERFLKQGITIATGAGFALLVSFCILCFQIAAVTGSLSDGLTHIKLSLQKRSYADPDQFRADFKKSLQSPPLPVVLKYLEGSFFEVDLPADLQQPQLTLRVSYAALILFFTLMSLVAYRYSKNCPDPRSFALLVACWFSLCAPLSWFIIFKAHSYIHGHLNFIVWQMPFTLFGSAVSGAAIKNLFSNLQVRSG